VLSGEATNTNLIVFGFTRTGFEASTLTIAVSRPWSGDESMHHIHRATYNIHYKFCRCIYRVLQLPVLESSSLLLFMKRCY